MKRTATAIALLLALCSGAATHAATPDPLGSARWDDMAKLFFSGERVEFDPRVGVSVPAFAEDSMNVPVAVRVSGLPGVERVVVFADFNPILKVLEFFPRAAEPYLAFRIKLQQSSPIRAAARTADGVWHLGGAWVDAAGGGCTAPSAGRGKSDWVETLGSVSARLFPRSEGARVRLMVMHPMDTGLAPGIPAFYIERLVLRDEAGTEYLEIHTFEPVSENPVFSFDIGAGARPRGALVLEGRDNNGNRIEARIGR